MDEEGPAIPSFSTVASRSLGASLEDSFEGEGLEEVGPPAPSQLPDEALLARLVDLCGGEAKENGRVPLLHLMHVIESGCLDYTPQDLKTLSQVHDALLCESEKMGLLTKGGAEAIVDVWNSQVIRDLLNHYRQHGDQLDSWEPSLSTFLDTSKWSPSPSSPLSTAAASTNGVGDASPDGSSSAGILSSLEVSLFSCGSREGISGEQSSSEARAEIEREAEQLRHFNRKLAEEKAQLVKHVTVTDEANQQLIQENKNLINHVQNMQRQVEQSKVTAKECEEMRAALAQNECSARDNLRRLQLTEATNHTLRKQLAALTCDLEHVQNKLDAAKQKEEDVFKVLCEQKQRVQSLGEEREHFEELYLQESSKFKKAQEMISELKGAVELLKHEKQNLEFQLYQSQQEILQLKQLVGCQPVGPKKAEGEEGGPVSDEGVFDDQCGTPPSPRSPAPLLSICQESSLSSSPLISSLGQRTPFCGRTSTHIWTVSTTPSSHEDSLHRRNFLNSVQQNGILHVIQDSASDSSEGEVETDMQVQELLQRLAGKETEAGELTFKLEQYQREQATLEERIWRCQRLLSTVSSALSSSCAVMKQINAEAARILESQNDASTLFAQLKEDTQLVNAFQEVGTNVGYTYPEDILRDQISIELQTLRTQITRSQAVLAYLQTRAPRPPARAPSDPTSSRRVRTFRRGCSEEGAQTEEQPYDVPYRIRSAAKRTVSRQQSNPEACPACGSELSSRGSSPLRRSRLFATRSCPALPSCEVPVTRGTQTSATALLSRDSQTDVSELPKVPSTALETVTESEGKEDVGSPLPRNRSASFVRAIREGNPNLVDAAPEGDEAQVASQVDVDHDQRPSDFMPSKSCSRQMPRVMVEDVDAPVLEGTPARTASAKRKCLSEVTRSVAIDLDHDPVEEDSSHPKGPWKRAREQGGLGLRRPMPDLMEGSETESAKGSLEVDDGAFPSLSDAVLGGLALAKEASSEQLTEQEIESKFASLSLGFKTDKLTLAKRLELHQRHRDVAEKNIVTELKAIRDLTNTLNKMCADDKLREVITKIQSHIEVIQQSTDRVSSRAEVYGAVQQEERMCRAFEVMVAHVENLKRSSEKEHHELEEMRRLMLDHQLHASQEGTSCTSPGKDSRSRLFSVPTSGTSPALSRLVRAATTIRRCSLPVTQAVLPPEDSHHAALKNGAKDSEEHAGDETVIQGAKAEVLHDHKAGDAEEKATTDTLSGTPAAEESTLAPEEATVVSEGTGFAEESDVASLGQCSEHGVGQAEDESTQEGGRTVLEPEDLWTHWTTSLLTRLKHWLESGRRALVRKRRPLLNSETFTTARYVFSGFLLVAALFSLLMALLPSPTGANCSARHRSVWELIDFSGPYMVELRWWDGPPPT